MEFVGILFVLGFALSVILGLPYLIWVVGSAASETYKYKKVKDEMDAAESRRRQQKRERDERDAAAYRRLKREEDDYYRALMDDEPPQDTQ